jgi:hypothetical protein
MARARLGAVLLVTTCLTVAAPVTANAAMAVFDGTLVGKAIEQIKEAKAQLAAALEQISVLKEQLSFLTDITGFINDVSDAIGEIATIDIPLPDIMQAAAQIKSDIRCLTPDGPGWGIKFSDLNLASICETSSKYREALFIDQDKLKGQAFAKSEAAWARVEERRDALLEDTAVRAIAQSDIQIKQTERLSKTADQLQAQLKRAKTLQERQHIMDELQLLQVRATISQNQMMAQQLKLLSIAEIKKGLPPNKVAATTGVVDEEAQE